MHEYLGIVVVPCHKKTGCDERRRSETSGREETKSWKTGCWESENPHAQEGGPRPASEMPKESLGKEGEDYGGQRGREHV